MSLDAAVMGRAPKVLLHDHLDGGLRPRTVIELAAATGYDGLPTTDPDDLGRWFTSGADRKSLELYLEGFHHTTAVMQTPDAIERVAAECRRAGDRPGLRLVNEPGSVDDLEV